MEVLSDCLQVSVVKKAPHTDEHAINGGRSVRTDPTCGFQQQPANFFPIFNGPLQFPNSRTEPLGNQRLPQVVGVEESDVYPRAWAAMIKRRAVQVLLPGAAIAAFLVLVRERGWVPFFVAPTPTPAPATFECVFMSGETVSYPMGMRPLSSFLSNASPQSSRPSVFELSTSVSNAGPPPAPPASPLVSRSLSNRSSRGSAFTYASAASISDFLI
ncbi:hypothetical protein SCP_0704410 [Sparassis crispa]|uniref:Uncharacterized protein n=1 Tax=Sparassis crispa TaxID=139825 RepID=A0A401GU50_9APHY|nr:hypothetical protein SCP_0704410 [Sparassis crispa]GBE85254.1 hypothetical protein SCP_0704410 [Sparassis crispa]